MATDLEDEGALPDLRRGKPEQVPLTGEALLTAQRLRTRLGLASLKDVVYAGLALLKEAEGKEVILRDPVTLIEEPIPLVWR